ncbi:GNAT family N-acetyltransferase [Rhizobium oryzihabitans]|uniref:GNAT family N-acetyltransferase n=1 Tax=Rhizobium oryzihabitans TaxID=2267833 RepID=A0A7L5BEQ3_9HYPH|nr:GNAT family N-acetyltransferase [Rhizobium oryzihabitans]QCM04669.1 GNAT family N-acetyltransferase [Agrobacterium tumefaciens]QIB37321.1 GNAT family N-acetyltransferase [Rhizobium oryzihabitans]WKL20941.1 GNAT family N-acetyltransferase [Agrobacterium tumefaciens]
MLTFRSARLEDEDALYAISLATGDAGEDATPLYRDGRMVGHIYSAPYLHLWPDAVFVAEDEEGVCGYIAGTLDTALHEARLEEEWWPHLRALYPDPGGDQQTWDADQRRAHFIHHPRRTPIWLTDPFPAHIHMNLLPRTQGKGGGTRLLSRWLDMARQNNVYGIHLGASERNSAGMRFWETRGFKRLDSHETPGTVWFGMALE